MYQSTYFFGSKDSVWCKKISWTSFRTTQQHSINENMVNTSHLEHHTVFGKKYPNFDKKYREKHVIIHKPFSCRQHIEHVSPSCDTECQPIWGFPQWITTGRSISNSLFCSWDISWRNPRGLEESPSISQSLKKCK